MKGKSRFGLPVAAVLLPAVVFAGCGVRYPRNYVLNLTAPPPVLEAPPNAVPGPLSIREFRCPDYLADGRIVYRPSPEEVGFYEYHRWAVSPTEAITELITGTVRARSLFQRVATHERGTEAAYLLSGKIEQLEEVDSGREVRAVCTISAELRDVRTGQIVWSHTASEMVPVEKRNVAGVVSSLSAAAQTAVDRLVESMRDQLTSGRAALK
ncbi:MAG: ABC-type transport auxiliary lipoprotein family protein [Acidobacteriota bacterium]